MDIGKKLKQHRTKLGYTQQEAAEKMHVTRQTISNWENERSYPDLQSVVRLSDIYEVSLDELLKGDNNMVQKVSNQERKKGVWIGIIPIIIVFYLLPALPQSPDGGGEVVILGMLVPTILFILNVFYAWILKFTWKFSVVSSLLFIPVIFIYFNLSAWGFVIAFMIISLLGNLVGFIILKLINFVCKMKLNTN